MKLCHSYGRWFQFVQVTKRNSLHRNGLTTREVLWSNFFTMYLASLLMIMCEFSVKLIVSTHKHFMYFTYAMIFSKDVEMWKMNSQFFNFWSLIFWMKIQYAGWFQYKSFSCCNLSFLDILYIHAWRTCLPCSGNICLCK